MDSSATGIIAQIKNEGEEMSDLKKGLPCKERKGYLGEALREFRKKSGMTQAKVAEGCGISATQYNYYEKGHYFPDTDKLIEICRCIGADPLAVFAAALNRSKGDIIPVQTFESVAKAFHKRVDEIASEEITLM